MTAEEKQKVFDLLEKTSSWCHGYSVHIFDSTPVFEDDEEVEVQATAIPETQPEQEVPEATAAKPATTAEKLASIKAKIESCNNCILGKTRLRTVPGEGVENPLVLVVGEGPGEEEDKTGRPFVGKAGQLLDKMLAAISLDRTKNCYIANIVKCRPPMNRTPMSDEASACSGFLQAQIHALKPAFILAMGRCAVQNLLQTGQGLNAVRGKWFEYNGIPLLATFHPSALLREPEKKALAWADLKVFRQKLSEKFPDYQDKFKN